MNRTLSQFGATARRCRCCLVSRHRPHLAQTKSCTTCGVVESIRYVEEAGKTSGVGMVAGGVVGGVLGHQIGSGRGNTVATIAGAAGGAYAGNAIEKNKNKKGHYEVAVKLDNGQTSRPCRRTTAAHGEAGRAREDRRRQPARADQPSKAPSRKAPRTPGARRAGAPSTVQRAPNRARRRTRRRLPGALRSVMRAGRPGRLMSCCRRWRDTSLRCPLRNRVRRRCRGRDSGRQCRRMHRRHRRHRCETLGAQRRYGALAVAAPPTPAPWTGCGTFVAGAAIAGERCGPAFTSVRAGGASTTRPPLPGVAEGGATTGAAGGANCAAWRCAFGSKRSPAAPASDPRCVRHVGADAVRAVAGAGFVAAIDGSTGYGVARLLCTLAAVGACVRWTTGGAPAPGVAAGGRERPGATDGGDASTGALAASWVGTRTRSAATGRAPINPAAPTAVIAPGTALFA